MKRVLVACEYSGIVRDAFKEEGYYAISCDLLPTEKPGEHYQGDVREILNEGWDLMIAHPPCTYLSNAGIGSFNEEKYGDKARERKRKRLEAFEFIKLLWNAPIPRICIENPVGFLNNNWQKPTQIIQPYHFGDTESKRTCLWLKNLLSLKSTKIVSPTIYGYRKSGKSKGKRKYYVNYKKTAKERSRFFEGIAKAMANQWGELL